MKGHLFPLPLQAGHDRCQLEQFSSQKVSFEKTSIFIERACFPPNMTPFHKPKRLKSKRDLTLLAVWGFFPSLSLSIFQWKIFRVWVFSPLLKCQHFPKAEGGKKRRKEKHVLTSSSQSQMAQSWIWSGKYAGGEKMGVPWFQAQSGLRTVYHNPFV